MAFHRRFALMNGYEVDPHLSIFMCLFEERAEFHPDDSYKADDIRQLMLACYFPVWANSLCESPQNAFGL